MTTPPAFSRREATDSENNHHHTDYQNDLTLDVLLAQSTDNAPAEQPECISLAELLREQQADPFSTAICSRPNGGERLPFSSKSKK